MATHLDVLRAQTTEEEIVRKQHQDSESTSTRQDEEVLYKIDIPANRYDMLCLEGIARALNVFLRRHPAVEYSVNKLPSPSLSLPAEHHCNLRCRSSRSIMLLCASAPNTSLGLCVSSQES